LLDEYYGVDGFIKVGVIEAELGYPLRIAEKYGSMEDNDYFSRRMRVQFDEYLACLGIMDFDMKCNEEIKNSMIDFVNEKLGHTTWCVIAQHRQERRQQLKHEKDFDPSPEKLRNVIEPRVTKLGKAVQQQSTVSKQIESQIPMSGID